MVVKVHLQSDHFHFLPHSFKICKNCIILKARAQVLAKKEGFMSASIIMLIACEGYQPIEYAIPKKILEQAGFMVTTASNKPDMAVAADKTTAHVDLTLNNVIIDHFSAIVLVGGPGAMDHLDNPVVYSLIKTAVRAKKIIGAICISPRILAKAGILKGKRATGWDGDGQLASVLREYGAIYEHRPVVIDGSIITATGPNAAREFGTKLVERLLR